MQYVIKIVKTKSSAYKITMPKDLTDKYAWSKDAVFLIYRYDEKILIIEPIRDIISEPCFKKYGDTRRLYHYSKPLKESVAYGFYISLDIIKANNWQNLKLLAVHDSGGKPIILEAFPNGTKER